MLGILRNHIVTLWS